jgi:hypothetical protein
VFIRFYAGDIQFAGGHKMQSRFTKNGVAKVKEGKMKARLFLNAVTAALVAAVFSACGGVPAPVSNQHAAPADELDAAIRETSNYLNRQLSRGNKLMILNVQSEFPALSEYIIDELIANTVNDRVFSVVDRQQLNTIRAELDFQMSGEVDDETAQSLGRMAGAQVIISGAVSRIGDLYRLRVRALNVQSAQIAGQFNRNIPDGPTVSALVRSQATGYGGASNYGGSGGTAAPASAAQTAPVATASPAATPAPAYKIGDTGPAGGLIFYDKGTSAGGWRYLEAAPADTEKEAKFLNKTDPYNSLTWGTSFETQEGIGVGKKNTETICSFLAARGEWDMAAQVCDELVVNGFDDWFLPSFNELSLMYGNLHRKGLGGFQKEAYWSSNARNTRDLRSSGMRSYYPVVMNFGDASNATYTADAPGVYVRAVRQF